MELKFKFKTFDDTAEIIDIENISCMEIVNN